MTDTSLHNWAGNITFSPTELHRPRTVDELQSAVAKARFIRALGTGHSFNTIAAPREESVSLSDLPDELELDSAARTVRVTGGVRFGELARYLDRNGFALRNMGSLPHIAVAGAVSTGTHGSGDGNAVLAASVEAIEYVGPDGSLRRVARGEADFDGSVIALGALGIAYALELSVVERFDVRQFVYEDLPLTGYCDHLDAITGGSYSTSAFTDWSSGRIGALWLKQRITPGVDPAAAPAELFGSRLATVAHHPIPGEQADWATAQLGEVGPWHERLPHFRMDFTPSAGDELQSEYFLDRQHAPAAIRALSGISALIGSRLLIGEIRTIAADQLWISPFLDRQTVALHFTWMPGLAQVEPITRAIETALAPLGARPHWGKVFTLDPRDFRTAYPRLGDFSELVQRVDPQATFGNEFIDRYVHGSA
ncbi:FAD-binding protein [Jatrophihabitans telluris]|uniref:FAD-binding protein n=1 Tax=Jatrophihabitans telluris TaxID=2038343 RepID=A0ABY4R148_9ACTN|nr:FAD-binding protein [Jatrophihabitans telluris]UQX89440.1 FAD-binding protein [Jatrophihabitans telluris]